MFYCEKFESVNSFIDEIKRYIDILQQQKNFCETKRNESGAIPNSFTSKVIFNFV